MPGRTNKQPILTNLTASDFASILRPTSGNNVEAGATDNLVQLSTFLEFILGGISVTEGSTPESLLIRIPGSRIQFVGVRTQQTFTSQTSRNSSFPFPAEFANDAYYVIPADFGGVDGMGTRVIDRFPGYVNYRQTTPTAYSGVLASLWLAVGTY